MNQYIKRNIGTDITEKSKAIFGKITSDNRILLQSIEGNFPAIDGTIHLYDTNGKISTGLSFFYQLKGKLNNFNFKIRLDVSFLNHCQNSNHIIILIVVDIENTKMYWVNVDSTFVNDLKIKASQKTKTIKIPQENEIIILDKKFYESWIKLCTEGRDAKHKKEQEIAKRKKCGEESQTKKLEVLQTEKVDKKEKNNAKLKLQKLFISDELKYKYYYAFIDLLEPFYLDQRGADTRNKLRDLFEIKKKQEKDFIERMQKENLVKIVGDICLSENKKEAIELQEEILEKGVIDLETMLNLFL